MKFLLGTKEYATQIFNDEGVVFPGTVVTAGPLTVVAIKTKDHDGYSAIQVGFGERKARLVGRAVAGQVKDLRTEGQAFRYLKEFRLDDAKAAEFKRGDTIDLSTFAVGDEVAVSGISKGKGFQGVVKRHGFHGGPRSHGQKHSEREPGSIGGGLRTRVPKGMRMAGRMGSDRITVKNLKVLAINAKENQLIVAGAIPGRRGTLVEIRTV